MSTAVVPTEAAPRGRLRRRRVWLGALAVAAVVLAVGVSLARRGPVSPLPVLFTLPGYALTDERAEAFGSEQLRGAPYVANFIYTQCRDACPLLTARMTELQAATAAPSRPLRLVSFSVDPVHDTPERLAAYAREAHADPARWVFLTGPVERVAALLQNGFKVAMEDEGPGPDAGRTAPSAVPSIIHNDHFALVDGKGRIRAYVSGADSVTQLRAALRQLANGDRP